MRKMLSQPATAKLFLNNNSVPCLLYLPIVNLSFIKIDYITKPFTAQEKMK